MKVFLQAMDYSLWLIMKQGPHVPVKRIANESLVPKMVEELDPQDMDLLQENAKAVLYLQNGMTTDVLIRMIEYKSAKEIWDKMKEVYNEDK